MNIDRIVLRLKFSIFLKFRKGDIVHLYTDHHPQGPWGMLWYDWFMIIAGRRMYIGFHKNICLIYDHHQKFSWETWYANVRILEIPLMTWSLQTFLFPYEISKFQTLVIWHKKVKLVSFLSHIVCTCRCGDSGYPSDAMITADVLCGLFLFPSIHLLFSWIVTLFNFPCEQISEKVLLWPCFTSYFFAPLPLW